MPTLKFKTLEELNEHFWAWLEEAYNHKLHSVLQGTPAQIFAEDNQRLQMGNIRCISARNQADSG
jgi:hypothetical protein